MLIKAMIFVLTGVTIVAYAETPIQSQCPETVVVNRTKTWTKNDQRAINRAKWRCKEIYPDAPCLKRFDKIEEMRYNALCGN
ncbi:MAG: hypothetical protein EB120_06915 [Proteobacteria bacterium]|nr:hypothetical protein [Pseudomonadota bacterium]